MSRIVTADDLGIVRELLFKQNKVGRKINSPKLILSEDSVGHPSSVVAMCWTSRLETSGEDALTIARADGSLTLYAGSAWGTTKSISGPRDLLHMFYENSTLNLVCADGKLIRLHNWAEPRARRDTQP